MSFSANSTTNPPYVYLDAVENEYPSGNPTYWDMMEVVVTNPNAIDLTMSNVNVCTAEVTVTGGVSPYSYQWNGLYLYSGLTTQTPLGGQTNSTATGLGLNWDGTGYYSVTVTDATGCQVNSHYLEEYVEIQEIAPNITTNDP